MILRIPMCNWNEIQACEAPLSNHKVMDIKDNGVVYTEVETEQGTRPQHLCEVAVPGACPRIQCFNKDSNEHRPCRLLGLIQSQKNESGFWMKLPCSDCKETRDLHPITEGFVYDEGEASA